MIQHPLKSTLRWQKSLRLTNADKSMHQVSDQQLDPDNQVSPVPTVLQQTGQEGSLRFASQQISNCNVPPQNTQVSFGVNPDN